MAHMVNRVKTLLLIVTALVFTLAGPLTTAVPDAVVSHIPIRASGALAQSGGEVWTQHGHDAAHTSYSSANGPNSPDLKWTYLADGVVGDPVVTSDGSVFFTVYVSQGAGQLISLHPDGTLNWTKQASSLYRFRHLASSPSGTLYTLLGFVDYDLIAVDPANGNTLWSYPLDGGNTYSEPTVGPDGTIYIGVQLRDTTSSGAVLAINPNGTLKWIWDPLTTNCGFETTVAVAPNGNIIGNHNCMGIVALDSGTGNLLWSVGGGQIGMPWNVPTVDSTNTIYVGGSYGLYALNPDGTQKWLASDTGWMYYTSSALTADNSKVFRGDNDGNFFAFNTSDGSVDWTYSVDTAGVGITSASALTANGLIYFTTSSSTGTPAGSHGYVRAIRIDTGQLVWQYEIGFTSADPAIGADGTLYIRGDAPDELGTGNVRMLYAFECADGICALPAPDPLVAPSGAMPTGTFQTQINLKWTDNSQNESAFKVERSPNGTTGWAEVGSVNRNVTTYQDTGLTCETPYYYRIRAYRSTGNVYSPYSNVVSTSTISCGPVAPGNLMAAALTDRQINLSWTDNSGDETAFRLERSLDGVTGWTQLPSISANQTTYSDSSLTCATTYYYRVRAYRSNDATYSAYSNIASALTAGCYLNDDFGTPIVIASTPFAMKQDTGLAMTAADDPALVCGASSPQGYHTIWYQYTPSQDGILVASGSGMGLVVEVWTGTRGALVSQGCADHGDGTGISEVVWSGLAGTTYYIELAGRYTWSSGTIEISVASEAPPSDLTAVAVSETQISLGWTDNSSLESSFRIERSVDGLTGWTQIGSVNADQTVYQNTGLTCGTTYYYRVRASVYVYPNTFYTPYSNVASTATTGCVPNDDIANATAITSLPYTTSQNTTFATTAADDPALCSGFVPQAYHSVWYQYTPAQSGGIIIDTAGSNFTRILAVWTGTRGALVSQGCISQSALTLPVTAGTTYMIEIAGYYSSSYGTLNLSVTPVTPPTAPIALIATAASASQINLGWTDNAADETNFRIERSANGTTGWTEIGMVSANQTTYANTGLTCGTTYYYRVRAYRSSDGVYSAYSNTANATTQACPLAAPTTLTATAASASQINLGWTDNSADETNFRVERSANGTTGWSEIGTAGANQTTYANTGLTCGTTYYYRVRAYRSSDGAYSAYSNTANATPLCALTAPTDLTVNGVSRSAIDLAWTDSNSDESSVRIERSPAGSSTWAEIASLAKGVVTYQNTGLTCNTAYDYRVRVWRAADSTYSDYSSTATGSTWSCLPAAGPILIAPTNGAVLKDDPGFVWQGVTNAAMFQIEIYRDAGLTQLANSATTGITSYDTDLLLDGRFYWRARGLSAHGEPGPWSEVWSFTLDTTTLELIAPPDGSLTKLGAPVFEWRAVDGVTRYNIQIDDDPAFGSPRYNANVLSKTTFKPAMGLGNGTWYWHVRAQLPGNVWSEWSVSWSLTVDRVKPARPVLVSPTLNEVVHDNTPRFEWSAIGDAAKYILLVDRSNYFNTANKKQYEMIGANLYDIPDALTDGLWFWKVAAVDAAGNQGAWSTVGRVLVDFIATPVPTLSSPADTLLTKDGVLTFTWSAEAGVKRYNIQIGNEPSFTAPYRINASPLTNSYRNTALPFSSGTWYWRVRAQGADDNIWGDFSPHYTLIIDRVKPTRPTLVSPPNAQPTADNTPTFIWNPVPDADVVGYIIQIDKSNLFNSAEKVQQQVAGTSYTPGAPLVERKWFWRVAALDAAGNVGAWSPVWNVIISTMASPDTLVIQSDSAQVQREGQWQPYTLGSGGYLASKGKSASLSLTFTGSQIEIVYAKQSALGTFAVELDGQVVQTVNSRTPNALKLARVTIAVGPGEHTLRIVTVKGLVVIDAFVITP